MPTFGSLFAGIGGLDLGLERAGWTCSWQVENDGYATKVLEKHWPDVARYGDVRECGAHNLSPVDLICGGFPCQDVSLAGKRAGLEGKRTTLWSEFARLICELRPRWMLAENVPGLYSANDGRFFGQVLGDLAACGYDAEWDCIPALAVGAPHRRYRVFIVAYTASSNARQLEEREIKSKGTPCQSFGGRLRDQSQRRGTDVANTNRPPERYRHNGAGKIFQRSAQTDERVRTPLSAAEYWTVEPDVGRVAHGIPARVDRLRCLGNAVVPQVAEWIGRRILECNNA